MAESKLHIVTSSDLDQLTLTESPSAEALLPIANVLNVDRGKLTRWTGSPTTVTITASRVSAGDSAFYASGFGIARHDFADDVTVRLRLYEGIDQTGAVAYDSTALTTATTIPWGVFIAGVDTWGATFSLGIPSIFSNWFDPVAYKSLQIDIVNPTATTLDIGRIYLGYAFVPTSNFSYGSVIEWIDPSKHNRTDGGGLRTETVPSYRRFEIPLDWMSDTNRERLSWLLERVTKGGDMLMTLNPNATGRESLENTAVCKRVVNNKFARRYNNINSTKLVLEEA
jgi:hypothetical protein